MKNSMINKIVLCDKCGCAFTMYLEGDESVCDSCIAENELTHKLIDEGITGPSPKPISVRMNKPPMATRGQGRRSSLQDIGLSTRRPEWPARVPVPMNMRRPPPGEKVGRS